MPDQSSFPNAALAQLDRLVGVWRTEIVMLDTDGRAGARFHATDTYRWMPGRHFLLHDVDALMDGQVIKSLEIIGLDPATTAYQSRNYDNAGTISDYTASLIGDVWSIDGQTERFRGQLSDSVLAGRWERLEAGAWLAWMNVTLTRTNSAA